MQKEILNVDSIHDIDRLRDRDIESNFVIDR